MTTFLTGIPSQEIDEIWEACEPYIELGAKKGQSEMTSKDIYNFCKEAKMQLWIVFDSESNIKAVVTTEIINYPKKKVCRVITLGGQEIDNWLHSISVIEAWAEENGCHAMETFCRKGFIKKLEHYGYEQTYTVLGKELTTIH
jgi:hypothetical protein|tara:strand:- start:2057 stop:2485 length:429 start_codon:yes stop_codon:yes gene_type:complete